MRSRMLIPVIRRNVMISGLLAFAACAPVDAPETPPPAPVDNVYVGTVEGTDAVVAMVARDNRLTAYVCGGAESYTTLTRWFRGDGSLTEGGAPVELRNNGFTLRIGFANGAPKGTLLTSDGVVREWSARPRIEGTSAGLYDAMDEGCRTGVIVTQDTPGEPATVQGTWCNGAGLAFQVTPVAPVQLDDYASFPVRVELPGGPREFMVISLLSVLR